MAAAVAASPSEPTPFQTVTLTGSGFALTTAHNVNVTTPQGAAIYPVTTDGSGAFTLNINVDQAGSNTITVTPVDSVAASLSFTTAEN